MPSILISLSSQIFFGGVKNFRQLKKSAGCRLRIFHKNAEKYFLIWKCRLCWESILTTISCFLLIFFVHVFAQSFQFASFPLKKISYCYYYIVKICSFFFLQICGVSYRLNIRLDFSRNKEHEKHNVKQTQVNASFFCDFLYCNIQNSIIHCLCSASLMQYLKLVIIG